MGSARKKKEKRKDFVKPKLRVGKTKPKATAHTDLGFKAKAIGIPTQTLGGRVGDEAFAHQLSLTKHHSSAVRKDALQYLQTHLPETPDSSVVLATAPLILDEARSVRSGALALLAAVPEAALALHANTLALYVHSAMTHINAEIRADSTKALTFLLSREALPREIVRRQWHKTLQCFGTLLGWRLGATEPTYKLAAAPGLERVPNAAGHLTAFLRFLELGLVDQAAPDADLAAWPEWVHADADKHVLPVGNSNPFARLALFAPGDKDDAQDEEDPDARYRLLAPYVPTMQAALESSQKLGGDVGRLCKSMADLLDRVCQEHGSE
ncbi:Rix1 complex component [Dipodascopsis tothii]|uniref:Rix1 complex component n=1 Tax=Dipodascopsis tothii TaxID=44089 RepID=UPI0034CFD756